MKIVINMIPVVVPTIKFLKCKKWREKKGEKDIKNGFVRKERVRIKFFLITKYERKIQILYYTHDI